MIHRRLFLTAFVVVMFAAALPTGAQEPAAQGQPASQKIVLTPEMVINEAGQGDAGLLVDEQTLAGDPRAGQGGKPETVWYLKQQPVYYPLVALIDLGVEHRLTDVYLYDMHGKMKLTVEYGEPFNFKPLFVDDLGAYMRWNHHRVDVTTRYIRVTAPGQGGRMSEIVLYGTATGPVEVVRPEPQPHALPTMDQMIGTNAFIDDPLDRMQAVGFIREYHDWTWDAGPDAYPGNRLALNPSYAAGGNSWLFDEYYRKLKDAGLTVAPCIKGSVPWLTDKRSHRPVVPGADREDPHSYAAHADEMFQFAARYGAVKVADDKLKLSPNQPRVSGLGLLTYYENANEQDAWWHGRESYARPYEFAAQCSADYDGHKGALGETFGVKQADPADKLVMGGTAGLDLDYVKAMKLWADYNRDGDFPMDVINFHTYSNDFGGQGNSRRGVSPEDDRLREKLAELVDYRNRYLPGKEVWLTEFGYDTHSKSVQGARAIGDDDTEEVQGRWLLRSYMAAAAAGIDRAAQYMLRDAGTGPGKYSTSGFTTGKGQWQPKSSWYYVYTLKNRLGEMCFAGDVDSGLEDVWVYRFATADGCGAYVAWCPTSEDLTVEGYRLAGLGDATQATLVEFVKGQTSGVETPLTIADGTVTINVSEKPVIVLVDTASKD